ncbi:MAG TPA: DUF4865 family protein [Burkholderiaceae bacterium]|nr:DUF4865 family protein [Burkholderiaceae bacterium]
MMAMQYSFVLPADYDMDIIRLRIASKGHMLDDFPGLAFKAYLSADRTLGDTAENLYAPFYLWRQPEAMHGFLNGPGFAGVAQAFGWPSIKTWTVWHSWMAEDVAQARHARRITKPIAPYTALAALREQEQAEAQALRDSGALAVVVGFEPGNWSLVQFSLWRDAIEAPPQQLPYAEQRYAVGHMSMPGEIGASSH